MSPTSYQTAPPRSHIVPHCGSQVNLAKFSTARAVVLPARETASAAAAARSAWRAAGGLHGRLRATPGAGLWPESPGEHCGRAA